jgi:two-component system, cell cycle sensor histidine kinase and response regulator CckA
MQDEEMNQKNNIVSGNGGILLVDDEKIILEVASDMLKVLGYNVYPAENSDQAISLYRENQDKIDIVILDMILHGASGSGVLQSLKELNPDIRVILSSGYSLQGEVQKVMEMGCIGFIQKPYNFEELSGILHKVMNS